MNNLNGTLKPEHLELKLEKIKEKMGDSLVETIAPHEVRNWIITISLIQYKKKSLYSYISVIVLYLGIGRYKTSPRAHA